MARQRDNLDDAEGPESPLRGLRRTITAVVIGVGLFVVSWLVLDLDPLSNQERTELFEYAVGVPVILEVCAERAHGDPVALRRAALVAAGLLHEARDRSAKGLIAVPSGTTRSAELERLDPEMVERVRARFGEGSVGAAQWQLMCTELMADFRSPDTGWAQLQRRFPRQLQKLDLSPPAPVRAN